MGISPESFLPELGLDKLDDVEQKKVSDMLKEHFTKIILDTVANSLSEGQLAELQGAQENGEDAFYAKLQECAAAVPGLEAKLNNAIAEELAMIKKMRGIMGGNKESATE